MTETTPQCPEALYTPETDTLRRCTQSGPHDWHEDEHGLKWRDPMAGQDLPHLDPFSENPADAMPQPITPERLAEIREREQAAIEGPWASDGAEIYRTFGGDICIDHWVGETLVIENDELSNANASFIAHARQDIPALLAELDRVRAERDAFADRVDTLTAVAKSNKRHVQEMYADLQKANRERDELKTWHDNYVKGTKFAGREMRKRLVAAETERDELKKRLHDAAMTKTWTNEDGKKFVFVEDIAPHLLGLDR